MEQIIKKVYFAETEEEFQIELTKVSEMIRERIPYRYILKGVDITDWVTINNAELHTGIVYIPTDVENCYVDTITTIVSNYIKKRDKSKELARKRKDSVKQLSEWDGTIHTLR